MKKVIVILSFVFAYSISLYAEDVIQIKPANISAGLTDDDEVCLEVKMINESFSVANLQFDLLLPEGIEYSWCEEGEAIPYTKKGKNYIYDFDVQTSELGSGYTRFLFVPKNELRPIENSGEVLLYLYITTSSNLQDGVYPILIDNIELDQSVTVSIKDIGMTASYLTVGRYSLGNVVDVDLSGMTGYIPSFVVNQLNTDIASNTSLKSLNLSGTTFENLGAELSVPNNNDLLWYTSDKASLNRTFTADKWSSVCLPVTLATSSLSGTPLIKKMDSYDTTEGSISLTDVTTMEKGKPYMVKTASDSKLFDNVAITASEPVSSEPGSFTSGNLAMKGTYQYTTVSSTASTTYYGFSNGKFVGVNVGGTGRIQPFRAYLELNGAAGSRSISLNDDGETTKIDKVLDDYQAESHLYNLQGMRMDNSCKTKGVYIRDGKKVIIK